MLLKCTSIIKTCNFDPFPAHDTFYIPIICFYFIMISYVYNERVDIQIE